MAPQLRKMAEKLNKLAEKMRARNGDNKPDSGYRIEPTDVISSRTSTKASALPQNPNSQGILTYTPTFWIENSSIADMSTTASQPESPLPKTKSTTTIHARGDPSYRRASDVRAHWNGAVQRLDSILPAREDEMHFMKVGQMKEQAPRSIDPQRGHCYCCPSPEEVHEGEQVQWPAEEDLDPDWRVQAVKTHNAGHIDNVVDFSEQHLAHRLLFNAAIRSPAEHLLGSKKAAAQELEALTMYNGVLRQSEVSAIERCRKGEIEVEHIRKAIEKTAEEIKALQVLLRANGIIYE
jgi:hypothetical protein